MAQLGITWQARRVQAWLTQAWHFPAGITHPSPTQEHTMKTLIIAVILTLAPITIQAHPGGGETCHPTPQGLYHCH